MKRMTSPEKMIQFVLEVLSQRRSNDGFFKVDDIAKEVGISHATAYRYLQVIEAKLPIERDSQRSRKYHRGVRCGFEIRKVERAVA